MIEGKPLDVIEYWLEDGDLHVVNKEGVETIYTDARIIWKSTVMDGVPVCTENLTFVGRIIYDDGSSKD
jgi:hypothetical protein